MLTIDELTRGAIGRQGHEIRQRLDKRFWPGLVACFPSLHAVFLPSGKLVWLPFR